MKSLIIGIARTGSPHNFVLNEDTKYIAMCGTKPEVTFSIDCGQSDFLKMINGLRYNDPDPDSSMQAISFFEKLTSRIFHDLKYLKIEAGDQDAIHIRLVTTPFELAQIPFEFVPTPEEIAGGLKIPLVAHPERKIILTREVRQETETNYTWPHLPRILFAWAQPNPEMPVPYQEHLAVLEAIVLPFCTPEKNSPVPQADLSQFLTVVPNASVTSIQKVLQQGIEANRTYTHIHILAHGGQTLSYGVTEFRLLLCQAGSGDTVHKVTGDQLADALVQAPPGSTPAVVTLAVCDSGHIGNTIMPSGSLAYQLHSRGIPCIFASQFPLTQAGSVILVQVLYRQLLNGIDPRMALYEARMELRKQQNHDWASLVAYSRFPEDLEEQLGWARLKQLFGSMKTTNAWVDHLFKYWDKLEDGQKEKALNDTKIRLEGSISDLAAHLDPVSQLESTFPSDSLQAEHLGLLGSAYKRKSEFQYRLISYKPTQKSNLLTASMESLEKARNYYHGGLQANLSSHWTTIQYLSLKAITSGSLQDEIAYWYTAKTMAEREEQKAKTDEDRLWSWGSLAELYLLQPLTGLSGNAGEADTSLKMAAGYLQKMAETVAFIPVKESTARQLERYIHWWPDLYPGKFPQPLKERAVVLRALLPTLEQLLGG